MENDLSLKHVIEVNPDGDVKNALGLHETIESLTMGFVRQRLSIKKGKLNVVDILESLQKVFDTVKNLDKDLREGKLPLRTLNLVVDPQVGAYHKSLTAHYRLLYLIERLSQGDGWHKISDEEFAREQAKQHVLTHHKAPIYIQALFELGEHEFAQRLNAMVEKTRTSYQETPLTNRVIIKPQALQIIRDSV